QRRRRRMCAARTTRRSPRLRTFKWRRAATVSDLQRLTGHRTRAQRVRRWLRSSEPGKPSRTVVVFLYLLLALLVFVDYTILTQAFVIIQAQQSTRGNSIGAGQALVVFAISLAAVF